MEGLQGKGRVVGGGSGGGKGGSVGGLRRTVHGGWRIKGWRAQGEGKLYKRVESGRGGGGGWRGCAGG